MKCAHCNSEWNTETRLKVCLFCGKDIGEECNSNSIENVLKFIISKYGIEIYDTPTRLLSYLSDYAPTLISERRLIKMCADSGILSEFRKAHEFKNCKKEDIIKKYI